MVTVAECGRAVFGVRNSGCEFAQNISFMEEFFLVDFAAGIPLF